MIYGNFQYPNSSFVFDGVYSNYQTLLQNCATDDVFVGRYVLVAYCEKALTADERYGIESHYQSGATEYKDEWANNTDFKQYFDNLVVDGGQSYDRHVFRKIYDKDTLQQSYEDIATLNSTLSYEGLNIHNVNSSDKVLFIDEDKNLNTMLGITALSEYIKLTGIDNVEVAGMPLTLSFNNDNYSVELKSHDTVITSFDAKKFIKDSFLKSVSYNEDTHTLSFVFETENGTQQVENVSFDIMDAGNGIDITNNDISIKLDPATNNLLYVDDNGLGLKDVWADQVYFKNDLVVTTDVGYITVGENGNATINAAGQSLTDVFKNIFVRATNPVIVQPSFSITWSDGSTADKYYEVGTTQTVSYLMKFDEGSYSYNNTTGVKTESFQWRDSENNNLTVPGLVSQMIGSGTSAFTFSQDLGIEDDMEYSLRGTGQHTSGAIPINNIGEDYSEGQIQKTQVPKVAYSPTIFSYRPYYYGAVTKSIEDLASTDIKELTKGGNYTSSKTITIKASGAENLTAFIVAIPSSNTRTGVTKVESTAGMTVDVTRQYTKDSEAVAVEANNIDANYDLWIWQPAKIDSDTIHKITLG